MHQGPPNPGFMQEKSTKRRFSKKAIARIKTAVKFYYFDFPGEIFEKLV